MTSTVEGRQELAHFLRSRRERITPEQVGLAPLGRRRTPGLRREEVAQLAGVGVTWYTWLEQGRDIKASEQVLDAVASTLKLDPHERAHLFVLAGSAQPLKSNDCHAVSPALEIIIKQLEPLPASVCNGRMDLLAHNRVFTLLFDLDSIPFEERNTMLQLSTNQGWRDRLPDWEDGLRRMVAQFRVAMAGHLTDSRWKSLVRRLQVESPEFKEIWDRHDILPIENKTKRFEHPGYGRMAFTHTSLWFGPRRETRLVTYTPEDDETWTKIRAMLDDTAESTMVR
ncbi:helix-turn-helix transcriptional regulator [Actinocrispum wychmicini]|uniref:Helix-turn-helix protein n=1 Tax=Actinocrispum wychmicini TaxID=1213861 RepID=A0A4R2JZ70_9PSEU|nr:helix-turn-helix transcriptional regulator [Actinocrispum wychmicini]TCO62589.1 helix-turn-helix protein [Actinocrispum wychmicini]